MNASPTRSFWILLGVLVVAGILRFYGLNWGLPDLYEEATPFRRAWRMWGFEPNRSFDPNPHFFNYPSLLIYLQLAGQAVLYTFWSLTGVVKSTTDFWTLYESGSTAFIVLGRFLTAVFGVGAVLVTYRIGKWDSGRLTAVLAALLLALNALHATKSQYIEVDVPLTFFTTLGLLGAVRIAGRGNRADFALAGIALGLATSSKYTGAFLAVPLGVSLVYAATRHGRRILWVGGGSIAVLAAVAFALTSPFVLLDFATFWKDLAFERTHMRLGHFGQEGSTAWLFYVQRLGGEILTWPVAVAALGGTILLAAVRRERWAVVLASFAVSYLMVVGSWSMKADRYVIPVIPVLILLAAGLVSRAVDSKHVRRRVPMAAAAAFLIAVPPLFLLPAHFDRLKPDTRWLAREYIEATIPEGAFLVHEAYGPDLFGPIDYWPMQPEVRKRARANRKLFGVHQIPMFQVLPEMAAPFYDFDLISAADYILLSSAVSDRYLKDPERFPRQNAFYRTLEERFELVKRFGGDDENPGPKISIFKNPLHNVPFGDREAVPGTALLRGRQNVSGEEGFFYYSMGLNYETFDFREAALEAYGIGLQFPYARPEVHRNLTTGAVRCLLGSRRYDEAIAVLERSKKQTRSPEDRETYRELQENIEASRMDREKEPE